MFPGKLLIEISDVFRIRFDHTIADSILLTVNFVFIRDGQDVVPFLRVMVDVCSAFPRKRQDALPVAVDPQVAHLLLQHLQLLMHIPVDFLPDPTEDTVPWCQLRDCA